MTQKAPLLILKWSLLLVIGVLILCQSSLVLADSDPYGLESTAGAAELLPMKENLPQIISRILRAVLSFLGLISLIIIIIAGFSWMTAGGSPEKVEKAQKWLTNGLIGLLIIVFSYVLITTVFKVLKGESFTTLPIEIPETTD